MFSATTDDFLNTAIDMVRRGGAGMAEALDRLPVPIYTSGEDGRITFANRACTEFAGRTPIVGEDRWCVTWRLYTEDGAFLPHERCPMAVAIKEKRPVRGVEAVAERPDGTRVHFRPYPTPLLDEAGDVIGAVNMLVDTTDLRQAEHFKVQAKRCRRLADSLNDVTTVDMLKLMASEYEDKARSLERLN